MSALRQKILNVGLNQSLLKSRSAILEGAGYEVVSAFNLLEVQAACETHLPFDLVILGQTLPKPEKRRAMGALRRLCGTTPILELYPHGTDPVDEEADDELADAGESNTLLTKVSEVLAKKRKRGRAAM